MVKFIHFSILDRTVITVENIYAPSDDGAYDIPEDLAEVIGQVVRPETQEDKPEVQAAPKAKGG